MNFPDRITVNLVDQTTGRPISDLAIQIRLHSHSHNNYCFIPKPSDESGIIIIEKEWLKAEIAKEMHLFIMDYKSSLEQCAPKIDVIILDPISLEMMIQALKGWLSIIPYGAIDIDTMKRCKNSLYEHKTETIEVMDGRDEFTIQAKSAVH